MRYLGALRPGGGADCVLELGLGSLVQSHNFVRLTRKELVPWRRRPASQRRWIPLPFNLPPAPPIGKMLPGSRCPCNWGNTACEGPRGAGRGRNRGPKRQSWLAACFTTSVLLLPSSYRRKRCWESSQGWMQSPCILPSTLSSLYSLTTFLHSYNCFT